MTLATPKLFTPPATEVRFFVDGVPAPGGSKTAMPLYVKGRLLLKNGRPIINMVDAGGERNKVWRKSVAVFARRAMVGLPPFNGPLRFSAAFIMPRPLDHFRGNRRGNELKAEAPDLPTGKPDVLKLARSTEDAMTGIVYTDDSLICVEQLSKGYGSRPGAWITIASL